MNMSIVVASGGEYMTNSILEHLINFCAPIVAIALVIFCVIQGFKIFKGGDGGTVKTLIVGVLILLFLLGIMYAAGSFDSYGSSFNDVVNSLINHTSDDAGSIVG